MEINSRIVAAMAGCSEVWIFKLRQRGEGPAFEKRGAGYVYQIGEVVRWIIDRETADLAARLETVEAGLEAALERLEQVERVAPRKARIRPQRPDSSEGFPVVKLASAI
jgi:hypothetical protein